MKKAISLCIVFAILVSVVIVAFTYPQKGEALVISKDNISYSGKPLYGISLENISSAADGGLNSNLVSNNSFEYALQSFDGWSIDALSYSVQSKDGLNENNQNYLSVTVDGEGSILNNGYTEIYDYKSYSLNEKKKNTPDMGFKKGEKYEFSAYFKNVNYEGTVSVSLKAKGNSQNYVFSLSECENWTKMIFQLESDVTADGGLLIKASGTGTFLMDFVTLTPVGSHGFNTEEWKYASIRTDLFDALSELSPSFVRFSGVPFSQCDNIKNMLSWKDTLGYPEERVQAYSLQAGEGSVKTFNNSNFLGAYEYFMLCADLNATPVPVVGAAVSRQENNGYAEKSEAYKSGTLTEEEWQAYLDTVSLRPGTEEWEKYINDILDLIEFANGNMETEWGAVRAANGHPEPFKMQYIAIGDECYGDVYWRNFDAIYSAVKEKYPEITVIASAGADLQGKELAEIKSLMSTKYGGALLDEHFYTGGNELFGTAQKYCNYERNGTGVMIGEWAVKSNVYGTVQTKNNIWAAVEEASFFTGIEENGDVIRMAAYSPVLSKLNAQSTDTSLIWFDSQELCLTPSFYTQLLFTHNCGNEYIPTTLNMEESGVYDSVTVDSENEVIYVKLVNTQSKNIKLSIDLQGFENVKTASNQYMSELFRASCNELGGELHVAPKEAEYTVTDNKLDFTLEGLSVNVIRIPYGESDEKSLYSLPQTGVVTPFIHTAFKIAIPCVIGVLLVLTACVVSINSYRIKKKAKETEAENKEN